MKQLFFIGVLVFSLVVSLYAAQTKDFPDNLTFTTLDGKILDSAALKSAPLVLTIGAAWCPECRSEAPEVQKAYLAYKDKGVQFLCVLGGSTDDEAREFMETYKITYPVAKDNGIADTLGVRAIPQAFFFSKGGKFEKRIIGCATYKELTKNIEKIIAK
ncbi:MAG: TlpA disulfide reductase family protein [Nitrospirota bacterium]